MKTSIEGKICRSVTFTQTHSTLLKKEIDCPLKKFLKNHLHEKNYRIFHFLTNCWARAAFTSPKLDAAFFFLNRFIVEFLTKYQVYCNVSKLTLPWFSKFWKKTTSLSIWNCLLGQTCVAACIFLIIYLLNYRMSRIIILNFLISFRFEQINFFLFHFVI